jgi:hypothetical protein
MLCQFFDISIALSRSSGPAAGMRVAAAHRRRNAGCPAATEYAAPLHFNPVENNSCSSASIRG